MGFANLPAGKYLINVSMNLVNPSTEAKADVICHVLGQPIPPFREVVETQQGDHVDTMAFTYALDLATDQPFQVTCLPIGATPGSLTATSVYMTALQVENLTEPQQ
jgi:hypothetical protein